MVQDSLVGKELTPQRCNLLRCGHRIISSIFPNIPFEQNEQAILIQGPGHGYKGPFIERIWPDYAQPH